MSKDIINMSWQSSQTLAWNLNLLFKKYQKWQTIHSSDPFVLLTAILSETSVLF